MVKKITSYIVILLGCLFSIVPVLYVLSVSLRGDNAFGAKTLKIISSTSNFDNYVKLFTETAFLTWLYNSLLVSFVVTLLGVTLAATSGYSLSRHKFKGKQFLLFSILTTQMFPATMLMLPFFIILSKLHLINNFLGLVIIYSSTALPFCIWQMKGYFDTIPKELEEAAKVDGCSNFQTFYKIILPMSLPALVITGLFSFMSSWSEYLVAAITLQDPALYTLPLGLKSFQSSLSTQWGLYAAGALIVSIPVVVLFIIISKFLVSGLTVGSVKG
ncbi:sugar ABC transporter permease [Bacteriovorax sp. Seq25_V]|uniref:sugar ABC transporter permease n=1 Tax=Bacteriovorax sp. Seq25_V TaxID=1201288 RepID=UPI000389EBD2|nr:carbohydrate ABC transporter permease [Bacteriovorax sp. Seq25_V]EQC43679.1 ABC transporter, permease protein [Bacteriovorax sp. Seq25_V]